MFRCSTRHGHYGAVFIALLQLEVCLQGRAECVEVASGILIEHEMRLPSADGDVAAPYRAAGLMSLPNTTDGHMFYYYFASRTNQSDDPVGLWIHGGPGCSGSLAVFYESGPYRFNLDGQLQQEDYKFGWDAAGLNMIYVDQPLNVGWSYSTADEDRALTERDVGRHIVAFLTQFFDAHPEVADRDLYLMGVSYAGHMVPHIAEAIMEHNKKSNLEKQQQQQQQGGGGAGGGGQRINLVGVTLGNPWVSPRVQYAAYGDFALSEDLISESQRAGMAGDGMSACSAAIDECDASGDRQACVDAWRTCQDRTFNVITRANPGINVYDIRKRCQGAYCYDFSAMKQYLAREDVRQQLGVGNLTWLGPCSSQAHNDLMPDWVDQADKLFVPLLEGGVRVLVYAGLSDLTCPWLGQQRWLRALPWSGQQGFCAAPARTFEVDGMPAGQAWSAGHLSFVTLIAAGHEVPMDQPEAAFQLISRFVTGRDLATGGGNVIKNDGGTGGGARVGGDLGGGGGADGRGATSSA